MIEQVLIFFGGMLVAGGIWLLALPAFWRRATRLTRERIESVMPLSPNEIAAEIDRLRAEHAVTLVRLEQRQAALQEDVARAKTETGERLAIEAKLSATITASESQRQALAIEIERLVADAKLRDEVIAELKDAHDLAKASITGLETQCIALEARLDAAIEQGEKRRIALDEAHVLTDRAREALAEETHRHAELRQTLHVRQQELRDLERRVEAGESREHLARIRGGEETYQSAFVDNAPRKAG